MITIGLLLPRSTYYTGISFDIFEGMKSSLEAHQPGKFRIVTENIGFGTDKQQCYRGAEQLIMHHDAKIVFAYISHRIAQILRPLFAAANRVLIVLDSGANLPQEWPVSANIFYHSLHNGLGSMLSSKMAADDGFKLAGITTGYYDGGYLHTFAAYSGFSQTGGQICFNHATGYTREDFSMKPLVEKLQENPESAIIALFSGDYLQWFFNELNREFPDSNLPIYLSPFALEESMLNEAEFIGNRTKGIAAWSKNIDSDSNRTFIETIDDSGRTPNLFSLLGWEAGLIIHSLAEREVNLNKMSETTEQLKTLDFTSPRGRVSFHASTNYSIAPLYRIHLEQGENNRCELVIDETIEDTSAAFEELIALPLDNAVSGWFNSYTCI
jgi:branched-chain amino acid transport system substrate-binding protein